MTTNTTPKLRRKLIDAAIIVLGIASMLAVWPGLYVYALLAR